MPEDGKRKGSAMNIDIAQRLYELRRDHGYSQESLAEALDISRQAISKWERAESAPDMGNLIALADLYEITIDELVRPGNANGEGAVPGNDGEETPAAQPDLSSTPNPPDDGKSVHGHGRDHVRPEKPERLKCALRRFPYPLLVLVLVLCAAMLGMWEFVWLFLTIPFYYWIARIIERDPKYREAHGFPPC